MSELADRANDGGGGIQADGLTTLDSMACGCRVFKFKDGSSKGEHCVAHALEIAGGLLIEAAAALRREKKSAPFTLALEGIEEPGPDVPRCALCGASEEWHQAHLPHHRFHQERPDEG